MVKYHMPLQAPDNPLSALIWLFFVSFCSRNHPDNISQGEKLPGRMDQDQWWNLSTFTEGSLLDQVVCWHALQWQELQGTWTGFTRYNPFIRAQFVKVNIQVTLAYMELLKLYRGPESGVQAQITTNFSHPSCISCLTIKKRNTRRKIHFDDLLDCDSDGTIAVWLKKDLIYQRVYRDGKEVQQVPVHWPGTNIDDCTWEHSEFLLQQFSNLNLDDKVANRARNLKVCSRRRARDWGGHNGSHLILVLIRPFGEGLILFRGSSLLVSFHTRYK